MNRLALCVAILVPLTSCTATDLAQTVGKAVLGGDKGGLTVETDLQNGDRTANLGTTDNSPTTVEDNEGVVTIENTKSDKSFGNTEQITINEGPDPLLLTLLILGWLLPSPTEIYREIKAWFLPKI